MEEIINQELPIGRNRKLIKRLYKLPKSPENPKRLKFCIQYLYLQDKEWKQIIRIDNYPHENRSEPHIHMFNKKEVRWIDLNFQEAEKEAVRLGNRITELLEGENNGKN